MIALTDVKKSYGDVEVLKGISFEISPGEKVSLLGPGGCGKTTILKVLLGLELPNAGRVNLRGTNMVDTTSNEKQSTLTRVGMAFQQGALFDYMTVEDNLYFAMEHMTAMTKEQMAAKIQSLLAGVKLAKTAKMYPHELSGGMQRRVGIARALATSPDVAIFDEPTSGLDPVTSTIILNMINELVGSDGDHTSLISTTNVEIGIRYAKRVIVVAEGVVVADGPWRELLLTGPEWVQHFLSTRLIGLDYEYALELDLPKAFIEKHWKKS